MQQSECQAVTEANNMTLLFIQ